ncbi:hypothetical protein C8Q69DRAFT_59453 [Paecilomyces variotii]|uniref:Uncharacterized protein n=1 Tax=Byssochlamys spectabilis TaxID=264951 RepID=A0A443HMS5_BYSSP|nr:hypothetical protein C8Q69DRAFT_59453 [Paecilomyces variotii]RWQ93112.1 hypothetical protein C8Q69DRAFT_59453 [Paecilomyces variotii]
MGSGYLGKEQYQKAVMHFYLTGNGIIVHLCRMLMVVSGVGRLEKACCQLSQYILQSFPHVFHRLRLAIWRGLTNSSLVCSCILFSHFQVLYVAASLESFLIEHWLFFLFLRCPYIIPLHIRDSIRHRYLSKGVANHFWEARWNRVDTASNKYTLHAHGAILM